MFTSTEIMTATEVNVDTTQTGRDVRIAARANRCTTTSGLAPGYLQANLIVLPSIYASDFRLLCARNPVACPLLAETIPGRCDEFISQLPNIDGGSILSDVDIRTDAPKYHVYVDAELTKACVADIIPEWTEDHVAFLIGCSFSFESALTASNLQPLHTQRGRNVPMYRTNLPLCPSGVFKSSTYVVSMRTYPAKMIETVRDITRPYVATHGEPIAWGWDAVQQLGIPDIDAPNWGDTPLAKDGRCLSLAEGSEQDVPVFWACGVTPQEAVMRAGLKGVIMAHAPGHMVLLDCKDSQIISR